MRAVRKRRGKKGQVLSEYAFMLVVFALFTLMFFVLMAAFSQYGARLVGLVSWEPNPVSRSQMERIMNGTL